MENRELEYMSDEELMNLIMDVEENHMMPAPAYLKAEILSQAFDTETENEEPQAQQKKGMQQTGEVQKKTESAQIFRMNSSSRRISLLVYGAKVMAAAAAAIVLMFAIPVQQNQSLLAQEQQQMQQEQTEERADEQNRDRRSSVTSQIQERSNEICSSLFDFSNSLIQPKNDKQ